MSEVLSEFLPWHGHGLWGHLAYGKLAKSLSTWARLKEGRTDLFSGAWAWVFIKNWPVCAKTGNLQLSLSVFTAQAANLQRLADSTHCAAPLCVPRFQAIGGDVREPYLVSASSSVCLSFFHSFPAPNQGSRIQAVRDVVIYNKVCLLFTWIQVRLSQHLIETTKLIPTPTPSLCRQRLTIIWMKT